MRARGDAGAVRRSTVIGGVVIALVVVPLAAVAGANGAFGNPAPDRVGSFGAIQAQYARLANRAHAPAPRPTALRVPRSTPSSVVVRPSAVARSTAATSASPSTTRETGTLPTGPAPVVGSVPAATTASTVAPSTTKAAERVAPSTTEHESGETGTEKPEPPERDD